MKKILLITALLFAGSASAQIFNPNQGSGYDFKVPVQPPEMRTGYGLEGKGLHTAVPYGQEGVDCVVNPVSMTFAYMDVETVELVAGQVFTIPVTVLFDFDGDVVRPKGLGALGNFYTVLTEGGAEEILIVGHTDSKGTEEYNLGLGLRRAGAVALVLGSLGFENIEIDSAGESLPVAPNTTFGTSTEAIDNPEGRQLNRRVDIEIIRVEEQEVITTSVVRRVKNPQIFHRLASNNTVACVGGMTPRFAIPVSGSDNSRGIVIMTVPR